MMSSRIRPPQPWPRHDEALHWINDLILDLKLIELGQPPNRPVDMTRLNAWQTHRRDIEDCKERMRFE
jgi:hypothetical protein